METGIYFISSPSGKKYIGSTSESFSIRWRTHKYHLRKKNHRNRILQAAWDKYGEENMAFTVYLRCEPHECLALEQLAIDEFCPEYNIALDTTAAFKGRKHTAEAIEKCRVSKVGVKKPPLTDEHKYKLGASWRGKKRPPFTAEHLENMRVSQTGKKLTEEHKRNISLGGKGTKRPPMTAEHRRKLSESRKGKSSSSARAIQCVETARVFPTLKSAAEWLSQIVDKNILPCKIGRCEGSKLEAIGGFHWKYPDQPPVDNLPVTP